MHDHAYICKTLQDKLGCLASEQWTKHRSRKKHLCRKLGWWFLWASFNLCHQYDLLQALLKVDDFVHHDLNPRDNLASAIEWQRIKSMNISWQFDCWLPKTALSQNPRLVVQDGNGRTKSFYCTYGSFLNDQIARWLRTSPENAGSHWELRIVRSMPFQSQHIETQCDLKCNSAVWHKTKLDCLVFKHPLFTWSGKSFRKAVIAQVTQAFLNVLWVLGPPKLKDCY